MRQSHLRVSHAGPSFSGLMLRWWRSSAISMQPGCEIFSYVDLIGSNDQMSKAWLCWTPHSDGNPQADRHACHSFVLEVLEVRSTCVRKQVWLGWPFPFPASARCVPVFCSEQHQQKPAEITSAYKHLSAPAIIAIHVSKMQIASAYHTLPFDESEA